MAVPFRQLPASYVAGRAGASTPILANERRRGGQPGNQNALRSGEYTRARIDARKASRAAVKAVAHLMVLHDLLADDGSQTRPRPLRSDQWLLLKAHAPELAALLRPHLVVPLE